MLDLKLVQRYLMLNFWVMVGVCLLIVVLYETEVLLPLEQFDNPQLEFFLQVVMEFASIIVIPVALKFFSIPSVRRRLLEHEGSALITWGTAHRHFLVLSDHVARFWLSGHHSFVVSLLRLSLHGQMYGRDNRIL